MKSTSSSSNHESIISHEHDNLIPDEQIEETHVQNPPEENDTVVTRKSKRQRVAKSFGDDYIVYLVGITPTTIEEAFPLLMLTCGRKQSGVRWNQ
jgi:hypothetical protein